MLEQTDGKEGPIAQETLRRWRAIRKINPQDGESSWWISERQSPAEMTEWFKSHFTHIGWEEQKSFIKLRRLLENRPAKPGTIHEFRGLLFICVR